MKIYKNALFVHGETSGIHQKILIFYEYYNHELR